MGGGLIFTLKLQGKKLRVAMAAVAPGLGSLRPSLVGLGGSGSLRGSSADGYFSVPCRKHLLGLSLPTRHLEMGWPSGVPWGGPRVGTWARLLAGRKCRCLSPALHSGFLPSRKGWRVGLPANHPSGSQSHLGRGGLVHLGPAGFWSPSGLDQLAWPLEACQASSFPSLWKFGAWVGTPGRLDG